MQIDRYKLKVSSFTTDLDTELDRELRSVVTSEVEIYDVSTPDNADGTFDKVYKAKVVGSTDITQSNQKVVKGKSKRSPSRKLRQALWCINPDEEFYEKTMDKIIINLEEIITYLANK